MVSSHTLEYLCFYLFSSHTKTSTICRTTAIRSLWNILNTLTDSVVGISTILYKHQMSDQSMTAIVYDHTAADLYNKHTIIFQYTSTGVKSVHASCIRQWWYACC